MKNISKHISWNEATRHKNNNPNYKQLESMKRFAEVVFEPVREHFGIPIYIWSFFRSEALNKAIKGTKRSQHLCNNGAAIDIDAQIYGGITNLELADYIIDNLEWDQLILEFPNEEGEPNWIHVSYNKGKNRNQVLVAYKENNRTKYKDITHAIKESS